MDLVTKFRSERSLAVERRAAASRVLGDPARCRQNEQVVTGADVLGLQRAANAVKFDGAIVAYLLSIVAETREHEALEIGVSPRGAIAMRRAAQARAPVDGRDYCIPEDVRDLAVDVFAHRVTVDPRSSRARASEETPWIIREILDTIPIPL